jgi:hypothetical protein
MIRILLSDDNELFRKSSREIGAALGFEVNPFDDWESAQVELGANFDQYQAVIIDGKGKLRDNTKAEDTKHLMEAIGWFREQRAKGRFIPVVIYTGFHPEIEAITPLSDQIIKVFDKSATKFEEVLALLKAEVVKLPIEKLKAKYGDVFSAFGTKYIPEGATKILIELLNDHEAGVYQKTYFNKIRDLVEEILIRANQIDKGFFPDELLKDKQTGRPNLTMSTLYWSGIEIDLTKIGGTGNVKAKAPILPKHLGRTYSGLIDITNVLSHRYNEPYTKYSNQSALSALLELICWFKYYIQNNYKSI